MLLGGIYLMSGRSFFLVRRFTVVKCLGYLSLLINPKQLIGGIRTMGIQGLSKVVYDGAPASVKENEYKNYFGRKVAIDASMSLYQFLIAIRQDGQQLTSADGETTSHLSGFFYRTIRMLENGIKPVYVFDGKPPDMKSGELEKRLERRVEAQKAFETAVEAGNTEEIDKQSRRLVKVLKSHVEEAQRLLTLMGVPFITAPCEAEAQCAALQKTGKVYAVATEDMDALTFGAEILLRQLTASEAKKLPVKEFYLSKVLEGLEFTMDEFIDLCILLGCDYCNSIKGIGPKKAIDLMKEHRCIEKVIVHLEKENIRKQNDYASGKAKKEPTFYVIPDDWPFRSARKLFKEPEIDDPEKVDFKWVAPDEEGLVEFMCGDKGFAEDRIRNGCKKLVNARKISTQGRLDGFFKIVSTTPAVKRPVDDKKAASLPSKKAKTDSKNGAKSGKKGGAGKPKRGK